MATTWTDYLDAIDGVASIAGLDARQTMTLRISAASWAMDGRTPTLDELRIDAAVLAGRMSFAEARSRLGL